MRTSSKLEAVDPPSPNEKSAQAKNGGNAMDNTEKEKSHLAQGLLYNVVRERNIIIEDMEHLTVPEKDAIMVLLAVLTVLMCVLCIVCKRTNSQRF